MVRGVVPWKNFDQLENSLILDEFLLLCEELEKADKLHYKIIGSFQGIDMEDDAEDNDDDLPEEILAKEREWQERKRKAIEQGKDQETELETFGIGYTKE